MAEILQDSLGAAAQDKLQHWLLEAVLFGRWEAGGLCRAAFWAGQD